MSIISSLQASRFINEQPIMNRQEFQSSAQRGKKFLTKTSLYNRE